MDYTYTQDDFKNATNVNIDELHAQIEALNFSSAAFNGLEFIYNNSTDFTVRVMLIDNLLSGGEKTTLDTAINNYTYTAPKTDTTCFLKDVKLIGTNCGTFTSGSWTTRDLNTLIGNVDFCTINSNQFTLTDGSYIITAKAPACDVFAHQIRLQNITDSSTTEMGLSSYSSGGVTSYSDLHTIITLTSNAVFEIQHICYKTIPNIGLGKSNGWGDEVYTTITIQKN